MDFAAQASDFGEMLLHSIAVSGAFRQGAENVFMDVFELGHFGKADQGCPWFDESAAPGGIDESDRHVAQLLLQFTRHEVAWLP